MKIKLDFPTMLIFWTAVGMPIAVKLYRAGNIIGWMVWFIGLGIIIAIIGYRSYMENRD